LDKKDRIYTKVPFEKFSSSINMNDPVEGFPLDTETKRKHVSEIYIPSDYYEKEAINSKDVARLKTELETAKTFKEIEDSDLFVKRYIKISL
jgi:hypothetical protein